MITLIIKCLLAKKRPSPGYIRPCPAHLPPNTEPCSQRKEARRKRQSLSAPEGRDTTHLLRLDSAGLLQTVNNLCGKPPHGREYHKKSKLSTHTHTVGDFCSTGRTEAMIEA